MSDELYRCPVLEEMGVYGEEFPVNKYDPRHSETLPDMVRHLKVDNHWTDKQVADWQETARPE